MGMQVRPLVGDDQPLAVTDGAERGLVDLTAIARGLQRLLLVVPFGERTPPGQARHRHQGALISFWVRQLLRTGEGSVLLPFLAVCNQKKRPTSPWP